jgi:YfiH family protein
VKPHGSPPAFLTFPGLEMLAVPHATTTRHCPGVTAPSEPTAPLGREAVAVLAAAGIDLARVAHVRQVHGADVRRAGRDGGYSGVGDVLVTTTRGAPVAVFSADCAPIVLYDPVVPALAMVHAGWRGTARGVVQVAVAALVELGARCERVHAAIAPTIGPCCYEVDAPVIEAFTRAHGAAAQRWMTPARGDHVMLDLIGANEDLLRIAGVQNVERSGLCTACRPDLLYSYRKGTRGRLVTVAAIP